MQSRQESSLSNERIGFSSGAYIGGALEAGGCMTYCISTNSSGGRYIYPLIIFSDTTRPWIEFMQYSFGGKPLYKKIANIWTLNYYGKKAKELAEIAKPFSRFRLPTIKAYEALYTSLTYAQKLVIAQNIHYMNLNPVYPDEEAYQELVGIPEFVKAVFDVHGRVRESTKDDNVRNTFYLNFQSCFHNTNLGLINAIQHKYGGTRKEVTHPGDTRIIKGRAALIHQTTYGLFLNGKETENLMEVIYPNVR